MVLGTVLLQTAPYRVAAENGNGSRGVGNGIVLRGGGKIGRMEVFLRAMKDVCIVFVFLRIALILTPPVPRS